MGKLCGQLRGLSIENLFACCDDQKYAKFLAFVQRQEPYPIENIGTILDRESNDMKITNSYFLLGLMIFV